MAVLVEQIELTVGMISARQLTLGDTPLTNTEVSVDPIGGPAQEYGVDFSVTGSIVSWDPGSDIDSIANTPLTTVILRIIYET